jgi:hypothetical protein
MSPETDTDSLQAYCAQWGELTEVHIMMGKTYGFVTFSDPTNAQQFLDVREHIINGKQVDAKAAVPKDQGGGRMSKKMFVGGTVDITDADFREYFSKYGTIEVATILRKPDGSSRGYGFVTFEDEISVEKCLVQEHELNGQHLDCKRANPKEKDGGPGPQHRMGGGGGGGMGGGGGGVPQGMGNQMMGGPQGMMGGMNPMMGMMGGPGMGMMYPMGMAGMNPMGMMNPMGGGGGGGHGGGGRGGGEKQPEWNCNQCGNTNFGWRQYCNKCKQMRPGGGGGGGGGVNPNAMMGGGQGGMMMNPNAANMAAMQMPMGMMGGMNPMAAANMMGGGGAGVGGMGGGMPGVMPGVGNMMGMGMMPGMDGSMGGMMGQQGGQQQGGDGTGQDGGGYGRRMGGRGNGNGQARFRPY